MTLKPPIPLIKEYRTSFLTNSLKCFELHKFDRGEQRTCVLNLYDVSGRNEAHFDKSIFRGMVIPSLRYLGLIYGEGDSIKVSANGKILVDSETAGTIIQGRALRAVVYELDQKIFGSFLGLIKKLQNPSRLLFLKTISKNLDQPAGAAMRERVGKWLSILEEVKLIRIERKILMLRQEFVNELNEDLSVSNVSMEKFSRIMLSAYRELSKNDIGIIKIEELRKKVCSDYLHVGIIMTETKFDKMIVSMPLETDEYIFSLGMPMGAQEKLLQFNDRFYDTLHVKFK